MLGDLLFFVSIAGLASLPFLWLLWKSQIESCRYDFFDVRDKLVLLVANGVVEKDSVIFTYYYKNVNDILRLTEIMHIEGLIQFLRTGKGSKAEFDAHRAKVSEIANTMQSMPDDVREVISRYYRTMHDSLLINSNFFRVAYLLSRHYGKITERLRLLGWVEKREPRIANAVKDIRSECQAVGLASCQ